MSLCLYTFLGSNYAKLSVWINIGISSIKYIDVFSVFRKCVIMLLFTNLFRFWIYSLWDKRSHIYGCFKVLKIIFYQSDLFDGEIDHYLEVFLYFIMYRDSTLEFYMLILCCLARFVSIFCFDCMFSASLNCGTLRKKETVDNSFYFLTDNCNLYWNFLYWPSLLDYFFSRTK